MAGQIIKRGNKTWLVRTFMGRDGNGKRRYMNKTIHGNKKKADTYLSKTQTQISSGTFVEPSLLTIDEYLDKWLEAAARPRLSERTFADYSEVLKRYVHPKLGDKRLSQLQPLEIQELYSDMQERQLSARTVRGTHVVFSSALKQAVRWRMLFCESGAKCRTAKTHTARNEGALNRRGNCFLGVRQGRPARLGLRGWFSNWHAPGRVFSVAMERH
jgi:integrase